MSNKFQKRSIVVDDSHYFEKKQKKINNNESEDEEEDDLPKLYDEFSQAKKKSKNNEDNNSDYSYNDESDIKLDEVSVDLTDNIEEINNKVEKNIDSGRNDEQQKKEREDIKNIIKENSKDLEENDYLLEDLFLKIKVTEFNISFFTLVSMVCSLIYHEIKTYSADYAIFTKNKELHNTCINFCLIMTTISVAFFSKLKLN